MFSSDESMDPLVKGGVLDTTNQINTKIKEILFHTSPHKILYQAMDSVTTKMKIPLETISTYQNFEILPNARFMSSVFNDILNILTNFLKEFEKNFSSQDGSSINKKDYFKLKDETELYLYLHLQELIMIAKFVEESKTNTKAKYEIQDEEAANDFWYENIGEVSFAVDNSTFFSEIQKVFKDIQWEDSYEYLLDTTADGIVSIADFQLFIQRFGPYKDCFKNAKKVLKLNYFYVSMTTTESQDLLDSCTLGTFLLRFNEKFPSQYVFSCVEEEQEDEKPGAVHIRCHRKGKKYFLTETEETTSFDVLIDKYRLTFKTPFVDNSLKLDFYENKKVAKTYGNFRGKVIEEKKK
eukprot:gene5943-9773_t